MTRRVRPPPDRLYGRGRGHKLRARQVLLLEATLPRIAFAEAAAADPRSGFGAPVDEVWLDVGFGSGEHALAQVRANEQAGLIACEVFENGVCSLLSKLVPEGGEGDAALPGNLRVWTDDARRLIRLLPSGSLSRLFLLFPDPWPKARHAKRRFVHPALVPEIARVLRPGGEWRIASDDPTYQAWVDEVMAAQESFQPASPVTVRPPDWPQTRYEAKAERAGRTVLYWVFLRRRAAGV